MSSEFPPSSSGTETKYDIQPSVETSSPPNESQLAHSAHSALAYVTNNSHELELEPTLAALSAPVQQSSHPADNVGQVHGNGVPLAQAEGPSAVDIATSSLAAQGLTTESPNETPKAKRLNRACDACSKRKVKCDNERPCKNCRDLNIDCTFSRPTKRRGPINRVAEEMKRLKRVHHPDTSTSDLTQTGAENIDTFFLTADSIAPFDVVNRLVLIYFTYVYPRYPFPHENLFIESLEKRLDMHDDQNYVALLAAVIGTAAASIPRLARMVLLDMGNDSLAMDSLLPFIERCVKVATDARGPRFLTRPDFTVHDANTSFLLGMIGAFTDRWAMFRMYMSESLNILQWLDLQKKEGITPQNYVDTELSARLYAAIYTQMRSTAHLGTYYSLAVAPVSPPIPFALPAEVDDFYVYFDRIDEQTENGPSLVSGANVITKIYLAASPDGATSNLNDTLLAINNALEAAPASLTDPFAPEIPLDIFMEPKDRRQLQLELLKAAVRIAHLTCRAAVLRTYDAPSSHWATLAADAASFLKALPNAYVEPQAASFVPQLKTLADATMHALTAPSSSTADKDDGADQGADDNLPLPANATEDVAYVAMRVAELERDVLVVLVASNVNVGLVTAGDVTMESTDEQPTLS